MTDTDVLIVGAGPVGLMLACELRRRDIRCRLIDKYSDYPPTSRANGLLPRALEVLDSLGIADEIVAEGYQVTGARIMRDGKELARIDGVFATENARTSGVSVNQAVVEGALRKKLAELGGEVEKQRDLVSLQDGPDHVVAEIRDISTGTTERLTANWVVGCDGAHSTVRTLIGLNFEGKEYPDQFIQADVHLADGPTERMASIYLNDEGLLVAIPFKEPGLWRLLAEGLPDASGHVPQASPQLFQQMLRTRAHDADAKILDTVWLSNFVVHHRIVDHYRRGHVFVAGDAAHIHSPVGGQGMNTGIQDAYNLGWKLALVVNGNAPDRLLDTYETERLPVGIDVLRQTDVNHKFRMASVPGMKFLTDRIAMPLLQIEPIRNMLVNAFMKRGSQLGVNYEASPLSQNRGNIGKGPKAGDRAPDGQLLDADGTPTTLFDLFRTTQFRLLVFQGSRRPGAVAQLVEAAQNVRALGDGLILPIVVTTDDTPSVANSDDIVALSDPASALHATYDADVACLYLVRPDGYVGYRGPLNDHESLHAYLKDHFGITVLQPNS
ncbi:oxygenase [Mycolicibacterium sp. GF69]|uniref:FAD-dependent monooxygenase n=1 Tax=Mycolicibacterium sp. GF69 TaxID=2267251 RepID=UPI000DCE4E82|nr:FAD-dependent monooxygenase [Mycolicibacterium sp. GF69]RAV08931.1 oxygenase [Mycolicibacterium sp. GF69]